MPTPRESLLAGRNQQPLDPAATRRVANTFMGFDDKVITRYDEHGRTRFLVSTDERGEEYGEIVFGPDIYPGISTVDANSILCLDEAAAHELTHYYRWHNRTELPPHISEHLDEALTSLEAIGRYTQLKPDQMRRLVCDAIGRINLYVEQLNRA